MLESIITAISQKFIEEARNSPSLMEDMAAMEKYLAESYGQRIFIELLQNADDAKSTKTKMLLKDNHLFFANNGRPINEADIIGMSRSGASNKKRGESIGYRGVGFKSTSFLTNRILIFSNETYFTYSKEKCALELGMDLRNVPTIRIPFWLEECEIEFSIRSTVNSLIKDGYTTVFVFTEANIDLILEEVAEVNSGYFIFLNHLLSTEINLKNLHKTYTVTRQNDVNYSTITISNNQVERWRLYSKKYSKNVILAFLLNNEDKIIPCTQNDAVFHCYLPTLEKTGYPFKINSDFSTDPSRKHLSLDDETMTAINDSACLIQYLVASLCSGNNNIIGPEIIDLIDSRISVTNFSIRLTGHVKRLIGENKWIPLSTGELIRPIDYLKFPTWLEDAEINILAKHSPYVSKRMLLPRYYEQIPLLHKFLSVYSTKEYQLNDWIEILRDRNLVEGINQYLFGKILGNTIKTAKMKQAVRGQRVDLSECFIRVDQQILPISGLKELPHIVVTNDFVEGLKNSLNVTDLSWFDQEYSTSLLTFITNNSDKKEMHPIFKPNIMDKSITKWRAAEQQCIELEKIWGNTAKDVSKQNLGYDVISITPTGETRYIEVKYLNKGGISFTMTNNEYSAAHQLGDQYYLCLIFTDEIKFKVTYLQNPVNNLNLEKRVRQWEWYCDEFSGKQFVFDYKN